MAGVPEYGGARVNPTGPNDTPLRSPDTSGMAENGRELARAGQTLEAGGEQLSKIFVDQQNSANDTRVIDAENQAREVAIHLTVDPNEGYTSVKGGEVVNRDSGVPLADEWHAKYQQKLADISAGLSNDAQRQAFQRSAAQLSGEFYSSASNYEHQQYTGWQQSVVKGSAELAAQEIGLHYTDPDFIDKRLSSLDVSVDKLGLLQGLAGNEIDALKNTARSEALTSAISTALDAGDTTTARELFTKYQDRLLGPDRSKVETPLKRAETMGLAQTYGEDYVRGLLSGSAVGGVEPVMAAGGKPDPGIVWDFIAKHEGGYAAHDANGAAVNFGINQAANPGVDVKNLTRDKAEQIFVGKYWNRSGAANLPPAVAAMHADTYFINPAAAGRFLKQSGGDPAKYMQLRIGWMQSMVEREPGKFGKFQKAWSSRNRDLVAFSSGLAGGGVNPSTGKPNMTLEDAVTTATTKLLADHPDAAPDVREAVEKQAEITWRLHNESVEQDIDKNVSTAFLQLMQNGGNLNALDPSLRNSIPGGKWSELINFADGIKNKDAKRDPAKDDAMYNYAITHPEVIRDVSDSVFLHNYAGNGRFADIAQYRARLQGKLPSGGKEQPGALNYSTINSIIDNRLASIGVDPKDDKQAGHVGAVRRIINGAVAGEQRRLGRQLTDAETESFVDRQFARPGVIHTQGFLGVTTGQSSIPLYAVDVGHIPAKDLQQIDAALDRAGQPKTDANRLALYYAQRGQ
jgi:hypothetical protein